MRVGFPGAPRLDWYDRNPSDASLSYRGLGVAPHAATQRGSYTVPTGKKAWVSSVEASVARETAATTLGDAIADSQVGSLYPLTVVHKSNTVGDREWGYGGGGLLVLAGTAIGLVTFDGSIGGTMNYHLSMMITEFSA